MRKALLSATAIVALSASAYGADLPSRTHAAVAPVVAPPVFTWTGLYVGLNAGIMNHGRDIKNDGPTYWNSFLNGEVIRTTGTGGLGGAQIGYNFQTGAIVLGVEADYDISSAKGSSSIPNVTVKSGIDSLGTVRVRAGYAIDRALIYVTGGLAFGQVTGSINDNGTVASSKTMKTGFAVGGGIEYALNNKWTVKAEGLYYNLAKSHAAINSAFCNYSFQHDGVLARVGVNYKF